MKKTPSSRQRLRDAGTMEKSGELDHAAVLYRKIVDKDPLNEDAVDRLLIIYRKLGDYSQELALINHVLTAHEAHDKVRQLQWVRQHSKAAAAGTAVFQQLGGAGVSGFGADPVVIRLLKRKKTVEQRITGRKAQERTRKSRAKPSTRQPSRDKTAARKETAVARKEEQRKAKEAAAEQRRQLSEVRKRRAEDRKRRAEEQKRQAEERKRQAAVRKAAAEQRKREALKQREAAAAVKKQPSLFVIILHYRSALEKIDEAMAAHSAFLDRHYKKGDFIVSGRQEPRTGGIILARGKDRTAVQQIMKADPFVRKGLADVDVIEFKASQMVKALARLLRG